MIKLVKAFMYGLVLAACFGGGYYWGISLKPDGTRDGRDGLKNAAVAMRDAVGEVWEASSERLRAGAKESQAGSSKDSVSPPNVAGASNSEEASKVHPDTEALNAGALAESPEQPPEIRESEDASARLDVAMRNNLEALRTLRDR